MFSKYSKWLKNKYIATTAVFLGWLFFFDQNNLLTQYDFRSELNTLENEKKFYLYEMEKDKSALEALTKNTKTLEKFAREKYLMKKDNEMLFVFTTE